MGTTFLWYYELLTYNIVEEKIYFKNTATTLVELLDQGFDKANGGFFVQTFHDDTFKQEQCHVARRSFSDLHIIANTYFDNITPKDLVLALKQLCNQNDGVYCGFCGNINRIVFVRCENVYKDKPLFYDGLCFTSYLSTRDTKGTDGWSFNSIKKLLEDETL